MNNLFQKILWGALILVWGCYFGASFIERREHSHFGPRQEFIMGLIASAVVLVGVAILTYRFARKHKSEDPMKGALIVSTIIALILGLLYLIEPYLPNWF